jgi:hypothetical protein
MASDTTTRVTFETTDTRNDEMHKTIEQWAEDLVAEVEEAKSSEQFQQWWMSRVGSTTTRIGTRS